MFDITVVVPSFNQGRFLEECLASILHSHVNAEIIVLDGGSTDETLSVIEKYSKSISYWRSHSDEGQSAAIQEGFRMAQSSILCWLNSDDRFTPGALERVVTFFNDNPLADWAYANAHKIAEDGKLISQRYVAKADYEELLCTNLFLPQESTFFRKSFYFMVGEIEPSFHFAMDYDLWLRMAKLSAPGKIDSFVGEFRVHGAQKSQQIDKYMAEVELARSRHAIPNVGAIKRFSWIVNRKLRMFIPRVKKDPFRFLFYQRPRECLVVIFGSRHPGQSVVMAYVNILLYALIPVALLWVALK